MCTCPLRREQIIKGVIKEYDPALPEERQIFKSVTKGHVPTQNGAQRIINGVCNKRVCTHPEGGRRVVRLDQHGLAL